MNFRNRNFKLKEIQMLKGHTNEIFNVAWNPASGVDGSPAMISSCGADRTVRIWRESPVNKTFYCMAVLRKQHTDAIRWCAWSPTGNFLATSSFDGTIAIWENEGGKFSCVHVLEGLVKFAQSISWNASGTLLATCVLYKRVRIWKVLPSKRFEEVSGALACLENVKIIQWHPLKNILFSTGFTATIQVWEEDVDKCEWNSVQIISEYNSGQIITVCAFAFNATSDKMVTSCDDFTIKIWHSRIKRMQSGEEKSKWKHLFSLTGYYQLGLFSIHWSREGIICSGSYDEAVYFFVDDTVQVDEPAYRLLLKKEQAHLRDVTCVQWSSKGRRLLVTASKDKTIKIWELISSAPIARCENCHLSNSMVR